MPQEIQHQPEAVVRRLESPEQLFIHAKEANEQAIDFARQQFNEQELAEACLAVYQKLQDPADKQACLELGQDLGLSTESLLPGAGGVEMAQGNSLPSGSDAWWGGRPIEIPDSLEIVS